MDQCLGLQFLTVSTPDKLFFKLATERGNGRETTQLMLARLDPTLDHTYMHILNYFLGTENRKLISSFATSPIKFSSSQEGTELLSHPESIYLVF